MPDKINELYNILIEKQKLGQVGNIPELGEFTKNILDPQQARAMYDAKKERFPDVFYGNNFDEWYSTVKKKEPTESKTGSKDLPKAESESESRFTQKTKQEFEELKEIPKTNFERRLYDKSAPFLKNEDGSISTHEMTSFEADGKFYAAPTIVEKNGKLTRLKPEEAIDFALKSGEYKKFDTDQEAKAYAEGGYKKNTLLDQPKKPKKSTWTTTLTDYENNLKPKEAKEPLFNQNATELMKKGYDALAVDSNDIDKILGQTGDIFSMKPDAVKIAPRYGDEKYTSEEMAGKVKRSEASLQYFQELDKKRTEQLNIFADKYKEIAQSKLASVDSELKNYAQTMDAAYKKQVQDFKNSLPQPKTQQEAEVLNKQLQDFNKKAFDATQKNIQDFTEKKSAEYRDFVTKNVNEAWDKEANAGARVYDEKNLNRVKGIFESEKFQKLPYVDQKALVGSVWYREKLRLMKAGKTPKEIADAKDWFYLNALGSAISNPKNKTPLSPFAIRSWAENMEAELDQRIAEQQKLVEKTGAKDKVGFSGSPQEFKDFEALVNAKRNIEEVKNLPDDKLGSYWEGVKGVGSGMIPFAGSLIQASRTADLNRAAGKQEKTSAEDLLLLSQGMKDDIESTIDPGFAYKVGKQTAEMLPYVGELIATGSIFTGARLAATEVLTKKLGTWGASKIAQKAIVKPLAALVGTAAQTVVNPQMYIKNTLERMSPRFEASFSEKGNEVVAKLDYNTEINGYSTGKGEDFFTASLKSLGLTASELFTERLGESLLTPAAKAAAKKIFGDPELAKRMTLAMWLKKRNLTPEQGVMEIITKKMAWDGILSELGEELINMPLSNIISDRPIGEGMEPDNLAVLATSIASVGAVTGGLTLAGKAFGDKTVPLQYRVGEEERSIDVNPDMLKAVQYMAKKPDYFEIEQFKNSVFTNVDMPEEDREILVGIINSIQDKADLKPFTEQARPIFNRIGTDEEAKPRTDKDEIIDITDYQTDAEKEEAEGYAMQLPAKVTPEQELQNIENALSVGNLTDQETNALKQRYKNVVDAMQKPIDIEQPKEQPKEESKQKPAPAAKTEQPETELKAVEWTPQVNDRIVRLVDAYNAMTPAKRNSKKGQALISEIGKSAGAHNLDLKEVKDKNTTKLEVYKGDKKLRKTPVPKEFEDPTDEQYAFAQRAITYGLIPPGSDIGLTDSELDKSKKALMAGKKTKEALRLVHAIDKAKKFNGVEVAFIDSLGRKTGGRSFVSFSEIEELMNQNYTGPKLNPDEEEALAEAYYELYDSLDDEAKEELDNLFLTDNEIQDENEQQKAQAKQAGSGKKDEDDIRGAEKAAAETEVDEPIQVMREISSKRPDLKDMFDEAEFYYNKMKSIREQIGFEKGQGLFVGINATPSLPFPYRLNSVLFSGQKSSDEARQKALNDFKQNLEAAKEYFKNPPSESEIKEAKEKLAEENKIKQESTKQKIDSTKENLIRLKEIYESEQDFINEIYPNKKESDRTIELLLFEGLDKSTIRKIKEINDVFLSLGEPSSFSRIEKIMKPLLYSASNLANAISRKDVDLFSADKKSKAIEAINAISEKYNEQVKAIAPAQNLTTIGIDASEFEGLLNKNQAENLQKEIERNYTPLDVIELGEKGKDIRKNVYNYDNPIAERNIDGINFRIAQGLLRVDSSGKKVKSYLLYANGKIIGEFNSIEKSKSAVQFIEKSLIKETTIKDQAFIKGKIISTMAVELGSDQGGISDFTARKIEEEDYEVKNVLIEGLLDSDKDLAEYIENTEEVRDFEGEPFEMLPIVTSSGEVLDGYNRIHQAIVNGETFIEVYYGVKPSKKTKTQQKPAPKKVGTDKVNSALDDIGNIFTEQDFQYSFFDELKEGKSDLRKEYEQRVKDAEAEIKAKQKEIDAKKKELSARNADVEARNRILSPMLGQINVMQQEYRKLLSQESSVKEAEKSQLKLFEAKPIYKNPNQLQLDFIDPQQIEISHGSIQQMLKNVNATVLEVEGHYSYSDFLAQAEKNYGKENVSKAVFEYITQRSILSEFKAQKFVSLKGKKLHGPQDVADAVLIFRSAHVEHSMIIVVNSETGEVVHNATFTLNHPGATYFVENNIIIEKILSLEADLGIKTSLYLVHNHPSGNHRPSDVDIKITEKLSKDFDESKINFAGHVIVNTTKFTFISRGKDGFTDIQTLEYNQKPEKLFSTRLSLKDKFEPSTMMSLGKILFENKGFNDAVLFLDSYGSISALTIVPAGMNKIQLKDWLKTNLIANGARNYIVYSDGNSEYTSSQFNYSEANDYIVNKNNKLISSAQYTNYGWGEQILTIKPIVVGAEETKLNYITQALSQNEIAAKDNLQKDSKELTDGWYSRLLELVKSKGNTQSGEQWQKWIEARANEGKISREEVYWTGLQEFIEDKKSNKIPVSEVIDFLRFNKVEIAEKILSIKFISKSGASNLGKFKAARLILAEQGIYARFSMDRESINFTTEQNKEIDNIEDFTSLMVNVGQITGAYLFENNQIEFEKLQNIANKIDLEYNYSKIKDMLPASMGVANFKNSIESLNILSRVITRSLNNISNLPDLRDVVDSDAGDLIIDSTRLQYTSSNLTNKKEIVLYVPTIRMTEEQKRFEKPFAGKLNEILRYKEMDEIHFGTITGGKALVWIRFGDVTTEDGRKVMVIDEIQSQRHEAGRDLGYQKMVYYAYDTAKKQAITADWEDKTKLEKAYINELADPNIEIRQRMSSRGVPDAPFKKTYTDLAVKRALRFAAENGYDFVAWNTGEQVSRRFNISQVVDTINYSYNSTDDLYFVSAELNQVQKFNQTDISLDEIKEIFGTTIANKIATGEGIEYATGLKEIKIDEQTIGAEPMKKYYGSVKESRIGDVGKITEKIAKSFDRSVNVAALSLTEAPKLTKQQARQVFESQGYNVITDRNGDTYVEKDEENYDFDKMSATEQEAFDILVADNLDARKPSDNKAFTDGMAIPITESIREGILSQGMFMMEPGENYKKSVQLSPENIAKLQGLINNLFSQGHTKFEDIMGMLIEKFGVEKVTDANNSQGLSMLDGMKAVYSSMLPFLDGEQYSDFKNVKNYNPNDNRDTKLAAKPDSSTVRNQEQVLPRDVQPSIEPVQGAIVGTKDGEFSISGVQPGGDLFSVKPISVVSGESSAREVSGREPRMGDGDTASGRLEQSSLFGTSGVQPKSQPRATDEKFDSFDGSQRQYTDKVEAQKNAPTNAIVGDIKNIAATLPYLMDGQVEDVWKAETRLFKDGKKGILFGNQTGTGKTFLFLGLVKRTLLKNPNANIVIISPTGPIQQTINSAKILGIDIKQVEGIKDSGSQVAITTYQNMYQNKGLLDRIPDLVIFDESHNLLESKEGREGVFLQSARKLMATPNEAFQKAAEMIYGKRPEFIEFGNNEDYKAWNETVERNKKAISIKAKELQQKTKVMLMSATPFAHEFTLRYADGLLFDINQGVERLDSGAYNAADNDSLFFITNFGYRMRYNKLTQPDAKVNMDAMYRAFADKLMKEGAMSVRLMDVPFDYSREFIDVAPGIGVKIDEGIKILNSEKYRFPTTEAFSYQYMAPLLEAIKAEGLIERVKQHIAMGRKVVVFHGYNNPVPEHPFGDRLKMFAKSEQQEKALDLFWIENPEFKNMFLGLKNPITKFKEEFGDKVLLFNGPISQSERESAMKKFNTDPNSNLILVNISAGGAGLSLHDQFGDKQRVLINLGLPVRPVQAIQVEGRIYRTGQKSNAIFEYAKTGLDFEMFMFGTRIAERVNATESLVMGSMGRNLKEVFKTGYINSVSSEPNLEQGLGGKEGDKSMYTLTPYEFAKSFYWGQQKGRKTELGTDYFATPEPIGFKMVEFADVRSGDKILEPSAGHGAIARFVPEDATLHIIEPSSSLLARLLVVASPSRTFDGNFEDYYIGNYYNAVVMNPPFGTAGKTAVEHFIKGFNHLYNGGRIVAIIPNGQGEKRFTDWYESEEANTAVLVAKIEMPAMFSERAGTGALTSIYIVDKIDNPEQRSGLPSPVYKSFADAKDNNELFDRIENFSVRPRPEVAMSQKEMTDKEVDDSKPMFTDHEYIANNGQKWLIVRPVNRFGVDVFKSLVNIAKSSNGWYMQKGGKGFAFKESSDASQFKIDAKEFILKDSGTPNVDEMINMAEEDLRNYVRDSMGKMSVNPFAATIEFGVKAAKLMGLYIRKGMKSLPEFLKKFGLQPSQFMRDLWLKVNEFKDKMWRQPKNITTLKQGYSFIGMRNQPYFGAVLNRSFDGTESAYQINFNLNSEIATIDTLIQNNPNGSMVPMLQLVKKATQEILNFISGMSHVEAMEYVDDLRRDRLPAPILYDYTYTEKERLIYNLVYGFRPVETIIKNIREAGGIIEESRNPVMGTDLYPGRVANKARVFEEIVLSSVKDAFGKPVNEPSLIEKMKADGINIGEVNAKTQTEYGKLMPGFYLSYTYGYETMPSFPEYLHALHAKERNEEVARRRREIFENRKIELEALIQNKINVALNTEKLQILLANLDPEYQLIDDGGSGMTNAEAESILNEMRNWPEKLELYNKYAREFTEKVILPIQKELVESGQISQSKLDELNETFGNWVHLPVDFYSNSMSGAGMASVNVRTPLKRVTGSVDRRVNPFLATIDYYSKVIRAGEMNKARQQMYNLIKTYPNENLFKLHSSVSGVAYNPDSGELEPIIRNQPPNSIPVYRNGRIYYIQFIGSNGQILFNAWNSINNTHDRTLIHRFFRVVNASLFYANIKFNPTFLVSNLIRDDFTAVFNSLTLSETKRASMKASVASKIPLYTPKAIRAAYQASRGKVSNVDKDMLEYAVKLQQEGGITIMGSLTGASNLQDRLDNIGKLINEMDESTLLQQLSMPGSYLLNALGDMQQAVENGTRLAAFRSLIEAGVPVQTAAAAAKNLTINFDRKGAKAGAINDFIWLFKTSASGIIRFGSALNTKEGKIIASALVGLGVMLSMWNRSVCEDGWNNVDDQIKYSKFVFIMNCEHQVYPSSPFAHGWGLFLYLGQLMESYSSGAKTKSQAVGNAVVAIVNTVNPLGSSQDFETFGEKFAPTAIQKVTEFTANRTWYDKPIAPEQFRFEEKIKDSELYWDETSEWAVELAKWLSENTGGELAKNEGAIELSPSTLEYLFKTIAGGAGRDVTGLGVIAKDIKEGKLGENITKYPLIRALVTKASSQKVQSELYKIYERGQLNPIENSDNEKFMALARMRAVQIQKIVEPEKQVKEAKRLYDLINSYQKLQLKDELSKTFRDKNLKELSQILSLLKSKR